MSEMNVRPVLPTAGKPIVATALTASAVQTNKDALTLLYFDRSNTLKMAHVDVPIQAQQVMVLPMEERVYHLTSAAWFVSVSSELLDELQVGLGRTYTLWKNLAQLQAKTFTMPEADLWRGFLKRLVVELEQEALGYCETAKAYLTVLLVQLARVAKQDLAQLADTEHPLITRVILYLDEHYAEAISLKTVAEVFHRSPAYLTTLFKNQTGRALNDYLIEKRLTRAKVLLHDSELSVATIGEQVGYLEASHFSRLFRKRTGLSPVAFRKSEKKINSSQKNAIPNPDSTS